MLTIICKAHLRCVNRAGAVWPQWGMWDSCWGRGRVSCWAGAAVRKTAALRTAAARCAAAAVAVTPGHWSAETRWDID